MKVMDEPMETDDSAMAGQPKKKKMVQALLPFSILSSPGSPNAVQNKKRKQMSPLLGESRSSKIVKIGIKENVEEKDEDIENLPVFRETPQKNSVDKLDEEQVLSKNDTNVKNQKKVETKTSLFVKKTTSSKEMPMILLERCDDNASKNCNSSDIDDIVEKEEDIEKISPMKNDESSNEELAKELDDSDDESPKKDKSDASSDAPAGNSDSDTEDGLSSSDDETNEQKTHKDDKNANGTTLDKTPTSGVRSDSNSAARKKLTPKQLEKKMESTKRREERRLQRLEREKKREEEKLLRQQEKEAKRREKKEKEEAEKTAKKKEKEQKELKRQMEIEQKQKEKERKDRAKEEDRKKREEAKEEEKRKKEEERLEAERKKQKAASTFASFFVPKKTDVKVQEEKEVVRTSNFMPFEVKADMRVAPVCRRNLDSNEKTDFDSVCIDKLNDRERLFFEEIKRREARKSGRTWPPEPKDDVIMIEADEVGTYNMVDQPKSTIEKHRPKLLAFAENRRPPYWGTWRKKSTAVTPRRPFSKDTKWFDYEVDSDEEWEEEEPGESLRGSDDEKDEENPEENEYDVDNEFMVPHGYLSDEEAQADDDEEDMSPETQKFKLKILGDEFEAERKTQPSKITPKIIGCIWQGPVNSYPENISEKLVDFLTARQVWVRETPIVLAAPVSQETSAAPDGNASANEERRGPKKTRVPDDALPELIRLIHGNVHGINFLVKEFITCWNQKRTTEKMNPLSKSSVGQKIRDLATRMACPEEGPMHFKNCWYVSEETRKEYLGEEILTLPNCWNYALTPKRRTLTEPPKIEMERPEKEDKEKEKKPVPLITQFTKKITQEEMKKQLEIKSSPSSSPRASTAQAKTPKRVQLISVARGQEFPKSPILNAFAKSEITSDAKKSNNPVIHSSDEKSDKRTADDKNPETIEIDLEQESND